MRAVFSDTHRLTPTFAEINLDHLRHNAEVLQARAHPAQLMAVVKANAYGHGAAVVAQTLQDCGIQHFAVATVSEALALREAGIHAEVLVFAAPLPEYLPTYAEHDLQATISSLAIAQAVVDTAHYHGPLTVHLKVDTGMGRIGMPPDDLAYALDVLETAPNVHLAGFWTHLANADRSSDSFNEQQMATFRAVQAMCPAGVPIHYHNSAALLGPDRKVASAFVRPGLALYGYAPFSDMTKTEADLRPILRFCTRVTHLKTVAAGTPISYGGHWIAAEETRIATLGVGYADGYPRSLSNKGHVGIDGRLYPVVGSVTMDMIMVDVGVDTSVEIGDEVVLWGAGGPSLYEVSAQAGAILYELCCGITARVPRVCHPSLALP